MVAISVRSVSTILDDPPPVPPAPLGPVARPDLGRLGEILDRMAAVLDDLAGFDPTELSDEALEVGIQRYVELERRSPVGRNALVFEAVLRVLPRLRHFRSAGTYLRALVRCSAAEGSAWARQSEALSPRPTISGGDPLPPLLPETARAVADGAIGDRHVGLIMETMHRMPVDVPASERAHWEAMLAGQGPHPGPGQPRRGVQARAGRGRPGREAGVPRHRAGSHAGLHDRAARPGRDDPGAGESHTGGSGDAALGAGPARLAAADQGLPGHPAGRATQPRCPPGTVPPRARLRWAAQAARAPRHHAGPDPAGGPRGPHRHRHRRPRRARHPSATCSTAPPRPVWSRSWSTPTGSSCTTGGNAVSATSTNAAP